jgi:hypothetical protein
LRAAVREVLLTCVREHDWNRPPAGLAQLVVSHDLSGLAAAGRDHGVLNMVHLTLRGSEGIDPELLTLLEQVYQLNTTHHMRTVGDLALAAGALEAAGVPFLVVKGPVLAEAVYPRFDLRSYSDLDLLVAEPFLHTAVEALEAEQRTDLPKDLHSALGAEGQIQLTARYGTSIDLHWHLINRASIRRGFSLPIEQLFARARIVSLGGVEVSTLDASDTLVHLALHAGLAGGTRLVWLKDVERAIAAQPTDWDEVVRRARAWGSGDLIAVVLRRSRTALGADIPDDVLAALGAGRGWQRIVRAAERMSPPTRSPARPSLTKAITRATRGSIAASAVALARRRTAGSKPRSRSSDSARAPGSETEAHSSPSRAGSSAGP